VTAVGWVDRASLGTVWDAAAAPAQATAPDGAEASLPEHAEIYADRALTRPMATVIQLAAVRVIGDVDADVLEIETVDTPLRVHGYVPAHDRVWAHGFGGLIGSEVRSELPAGTCLYDRPDGALIGTTLAAHAPDEPLGDGWWRMTIVTRWGAVEVAAAQDQRCVHPLRADHAARAGSAASSRSAHARR
jgi:hypothetical protein